jgi:hypothetical protein
MGLHEILREELRGRAIVSPGEPTAPVLARLATSSGLVRRKRVAPATTTRRRVGIRGHRGRAGQKDVRAED